MAKLYSLPEEIVFLSDKEHGGCIFMKNQDTGEELFPLKTVRMTGHVPVLYVVLRRN